MSKERKIAVPRLRFPEFEGKVEWEISKLTSDEVASVVSERVSLQDVSLETYVSTENLLPEFAGVTLASNLPSSGSFTSYGKGDILLSNIRPYLKKAWASDRSGGASNDVIVIRAGKKIEPLFLSYLIKNDHFIGYVMKGAEGVKMPRGDKDLIRDYPLAFPKPSEQQKIASCLSSLDDLIAAHSQKLEALKAHKKGLMQQLFPEEGETVPRLRFKEFEGSGEWEETTLGKLLLRHPEYGMNAPAVTYSEDLPTYLRITDISEDGRFLSQEKVSVDRSVSSENYLEDGDIVLARTGASVGKSYKYRLEDGKLVFAGFLIRIKPNKSKLDPEFIFQYLFTNHFWRWVAFASMRSGQPGINGNEYASMRITLPPTISEQQKIASCLSSLDALIAAQAEKLEALKEHKKGLMQGLFPVGA